MKPHFPRGLDFFLVWILSQKADSLLKTGRKGYYLEQTLNNWTQASESCNLAVSNRSLFLGLSITDIPILKPPTSKQSIGRQLSDLHWIGATGTFTPWFELLGCFLYKFVEKNSSITDATSKISPFTKCYQICKEYSLFGINNAICFCANNAAFGKVLHSTCVLKNSFSITNDVIGTSNTVNSYHAFAVYRKVERSTNLEDTLGECLIETVNGNETFPCDSADNTRRTWDESFAKGTDLNGKKISILPRWLPFVRRLMINWNDGSSSLAKGTVCISAREQNGVYEAIPRHCQGKLTSICQVNRTDLDTIFRHGSKVNSQETLPTTNFKDPVFSSLSKVTSQPNFSNSKVFSSLSKVTSQHNFSNSKESSFLIAGCILIALSGVLVITSAIFFTKAKRLKKQAEMTMIRNTYESIAVKTAKPPEYSSLNDIRPSHQQPQEIQSNREVLYSLSYT